MGGLSTGEVYHAYDGVIRRAEAGLESRVPAITGFDPASLRKRIAQRLIELTFEESLAKIGKTGGHGGQVSSNGATIDAATGRVSISPALWLHSVASFVLRWGYLLIQFTAAAAGPSPSTSIPVTVVWDPQPADEAARKRFAAFCRKGPIAPLREARTLFVRTTAKTTIPDDGAITFSGQPLVDLARTNLSRGHRARLLIDHFAIAFRYLWWSVRIPLLAILGRDVDYLAVVAFLDRRGLIEAFVTTTAGFAVQPIWLEGRSNQRFQHHMIWYSQNFIPKSYKGETRRYDLVQSRHMRVHHHWVWTEGFRDYLLGLGQTGKIDVVGPILLYQEGEIGDLRPGLGIAAFDITPVVPTYAVFGAAKNYYSLGAMTKFVADISSVARQLAEETREPVTVYLKQKRSPKAGIHETDYWTAIDEIAETNGNLVLMPPDTNVFGLVDRCSVTLSVPYTSTAYVATARGKPSAYYDPFAELEPMYEGHPLLEFTAERQQLETFLRKHVLREPAVLASGER